MPAPLGGKICCVTGDIGGGKTCLAVEDMLRALSHGRHVFSNIELKPLGVDAWLSRRGVEVDWRSAYHYISSGSDWPSCSPGSLLVLDEYSEFFDASDRDTMTGKELHRGFVRFLRQSRKAGVDVYLIGQSYQSLNAQVRRLVTNRIHSKDIARIEIFMLPVGRWVPYFRNCFFRTDLPAKSADKVSAKNRYGSEIRHKDKSVWACYDTNQIIGDSILKGPVLAPVERKLLPRKKPAWLGWLGLLGLLGLFRRTPTVPPPKQSPSLEQPSATVVPTISRPSVEAPRWATNVVTVASQEWGIAGETAITDMGRLKAGDTCYFGRVLKVMDREVWCVQWPLDRPMTVEYTRIMPESAMPRGLRNASFEGENGAVKNVERAGKTAPANHGGIEAPKLFEALPGIIGS